jgi:plasmid stabilization system protein ParE
LRDVARLNAFLAAKNRDAARRAVRAIREGVRVLARHPEIGPAVEGMPPEFRRWSIDFGHSGYAVLYRYEDTDVVILAVRHAREIDF